MLFFIFISLQPLSRIAAVIFPHSSIFIKLQFSLVPENRRNWNCGQFFVFPQFFFCFIFLFVLHYFVLFCFRSLSQFFSCIFPKSIGMCACVLVISEECLLSCGKMMATMPLQCKQENGEKRSFSHFRCRVAMLKCAACQETNNR